MYRIGKSTETERSVVAKGYWGGKDRIGEKWGVIASEYKVSFCDEENVLKLIAVMVAQLCEPTEWYTLIEWIVRYASYISVKLLHIYF